MFTKELERLIDPLTKQTMIAIIVNFSTHILVVEYRWNRRPEPYIRPWSESLLIESKIHHRLESCAHSPLSTLFISRKVLRDGEFKQPKFYQQFL